MTTPVEPREDADRRLEEAARQMLRQGAEDIDAATASRLNRARQAALAGLGDRRSAWLGGWQPALGAAAVAGLALALWLGREPAPLPAKVDAALALEVLLADENLEMIEDLEFYDWLQADGGQEQPDPGLTG